MIAIRLLNGVLRLTLTGLLIANALSAKGAEIIVDGSSVTLTGEIVAGDAEKFRVRVAYSADSRPGTIFLNSPGGNVSEALKIATLIKGLRSQTWVLPHGICASSCFFLYLSGDERIATVAGPNGVFLSGPVGLHRPFLTREYFVDRSNDEASETQATIMKAVASYLESNLVPRDLVDAMMSRPSNEVYWLTQSDLDRLGMYPPEREELYIARCGYSRSMFLESLNNPDKVEREALSRKSDAAKKCAWSIGAEDGGKYFEKLKTGWKPWAEKPSHQLKKR